jgi:hypothetical protein
VKFQICHRHFLFPLQIEFKIKLSKAETLDSWQDTQITEEVNENLGKRSLSPTVESL